MKTVSMLFVGLSLVAGSFLTANEPMRYNCSCPNCPCTYESNCGCYSPEGCGCSMQGCPGGQCSQQQCPTCQPYQQPYHPSCMNCKGN